MKIDLKQGDCLELMKNIPDKSVDMVLCDLPYGTTQNKWDKRIDLQQLFTHYKRIIKSGGAIALFAQQPFASDLVQANRKQFRYEWVWQKSNKTGFLNSKKIPLKEHENILIFYDKLPIYNPQMRKGEHINARKGRALSSNYGKFYRMDSQKVDEYYPSSIIQFKCVNQQSIKERLHPTQKPVPLLEYLIKTYTNEGETVIDNCMGSGSTGVACVNTNRNFIGIELDEHYFDIAKKRIQDALSGN